MKATYDCIPCLIKQTIDAARLSSDSESLQRQAINRVMHYLQEADFQVSPPELGKRIFHILQDLTGNSDPYWSQKQIFNQRALDIYHELKRLIYMNDDPVFLAAKLALSGNFFHLNTDDLNKNLHQYVENIQLKKFAVDDYFQFLEDLGMARNILYLADNAGEIVFDKLFIEVLKRFYPERSHQFTVVVRGAPIINDATLEDAQLIDMDEVAHVIDNGDAAPATILRNVSDTMREYYENADLIISKGQGNFESLHDENKLIYFMFQVRCPVIAAEIQSAEGSLILKRSGDFVPPKSNR
jgi:uncharacterized protein with ATP-grasp and redox domains